MAAAWCGRPLLAGVTAVLIGSAHAQPVPACYKKKPKLQLRTKLTVRCTWFSELSKARTGVC